MSHKIDEIEIEEPCKLCGGTQVKEIYDSGGMIPYCKDCGTI